MPLPTSTKVSASALYTAGPWSRHIPALDGVRGLAVLLVVTSHLVWGNSSSRLMQAVARVVSYGAIGVDIFFLLSGFLITGILFDSVSEPAFFRRFYARRALRIFPLYYAVLAAYAVGSLAFHIDYQRQLWSMALYLQNSFVLTVPYFRYNGPTLALRHFWSLAVEEQFYLVWPVVVYLVRRRQALLWICIAFFFICPVLRFVLIFNGYEYLLVHTNTLCNADLLLAGGALSLLVRGPKQIRTLNSGPAIFFIGAALMPALILLGTYTPLAAYPLFMGSVNIAAAVTSFGFIAFGLLAMTLKPGPLATLFSSRPLRFLGKYSYGIYVFHLILFIHLRQPLKSFISAYITHSAAATLILGGLISVALTIVLAVLSFQFYESRFLRLKRFFDYRPRPPLPPAPAEAQTV